MSVWDGPDDRPGSPDSLYVLYCLVLAAEEEDLLEELRRERTWREWHDNPSVAMEDEDEDTDSQDVTEQSDEAPTLTLLQILGMLEQILGAVIVNPEEEAGEG